MYNHDTELHNYSIVVRQKKNIWDKSSTAVNVPGDIVYTYNNILLQHLVYYLAIARLVLMSMRDCLPWVSSSLTVPCGSM